MAEKKQFKSSPRVWGYARVSTDDQEMRMQVEALEKYGVDGIFMEKASGKDMDRPEFTRMMSRMYSRPGDKIVVWKLDRLGRSLTGLIETIETMKNRGVDFVCLRDDINTSTATGRFFFHVMAAVAQWERDMISERTKAGMEAAKAAGKRLGPPHLIKHNEKRLAHMRKLDAAGKIRDPLGEAVMRDKELWDALNDGDPKSPIRSLETVRRWRRDGYPGLDE